MSSSMDSSPRLSPAAPGRWTSLWVVALLSLVAQLYLCQFFSFGQKVPESIDINPSNLWRSAAHFPPRGEFIVTNWLGLPTLPVPLNPLSLGAHLAPWLFFTAYVPVISTLALLAMAAFLRELGLSRPAALFGGLIYAWQGDLLPFVFPGHYGYITTWPFYAIGAWGALRSGRTGHWGYALVSGACCGLMVGLQPDRGGMSCLVIAALFFGSAWRARPSWTRPAAHLALCVAVALCVALAALFALFQSYIVGVSMGGQTDRAKNYVFSTQFSLGPEETLTYLVPGFFGWSSSNNNGPYWGRIGQPPDWNQKHEGARNLNLAISTSGTVATTLALLGAVIVLRGRREAGPFILDDRQVYYARILLGLGVAGLVLSWGYHTPLYRYVFELPLMDKWRDPLKWLQLTNFALITLSAIGAGRVVETVGGDEETPELLLARRGVRRFFDAMLVLVFLGLLASYPFTVHSVEGFQSEGYEPGAVAAIMSTIHFSLGLATLLLLGLGVLVRLIWRPEGLRKWKMGENPWLSRLWQAMLEPKRLPLTLALGLGALSVGQLAWVAVQFLRPIDLDLLTGKNPVEQALIAALEAEGTRVRVSVAGSDPVLNSLLQNQLNTRRISCLDISAASRIPDALNALFAGLASDPERLWFLAGVKNRLIPQDDFIALKNDPRVAANITGADGYMLGPSDAPNLPSHALVKFRDYLAKATFVPGREIIPKDKGQLARLEDPGWDPRKTVLLAGADTAEPASRSATTQAFPRVDLHTYTTHRIDAAIIAGTGGYLLVNDAWDPDWSATVNGKPAPVLRADFMLRAVRVPAGDSQVTMTYDAHYRVGGMRLPCVAVNLFSDAVMLGAWVVAWVALRRDPRWHSHPRSQSS
jgi:hypothetical protein